MSNIIAFVLINISTNWVEIGTFTPASDGMHAVYIPTQSVQRGNIVTNTTAVFTWAGQKREIVLDTKNGPDVGERRVPKTDYFTIPAFKFDPATPTHPINRWGGIDLTNIAVPFITTTNYL